MIDALYLHIPFCLHFCPYCDYFKVPHNINHIDAFINALKAELDDFNIPKRSLRTLYFGGGTPNSLSLEQMEAVLKMFAPLINKELDYEWSIEMNPERVNLDYLLLLKKYGVNRISLGVQTFNDEQLKKLGRKTNREEIIRIIDLIKEHFSNFSIDLIYGLPLDTLDTVYTNLEIVSRLNVPHLSFYPLSVHEGTPYHKLGIKEQDENTYVLFTDSINKYLKEKGYLHYEITNFAKSETYYGKHNHVYWKALEYYALGPGAHGFIKGQRYQNTNNFKEYLNNPLERTYHAPMSVEELEEEYLLLNLRLRSGINLKAYQERFHTLFLSKYQDRLNSSRLKNHFIINDTHIYLKEESLRLYDYLIFHLLTD